VSRATDLTWDAFDLAADEGAGLGFVLGAGPLARVHIVESEIEAQVLMDALEHEGILAVVQSYRELAFDGLFIPQRGWGCVLTREQDAERAVEVIRAALAAVPVE
jgi:hypothetical protein